MYGVIVLKLFLSILKENCYSHRRSEVTYGGKIMTRKEQADLILYKYGLFEELKKYGQPHIIGSYRTDTMAWNDLDIDVENQEMSLAKLYDLSGYILTKFNPVWYEAKMEQNADDKMVWFHGFEAMINGQLWNVDIWFFDRKSINQTERYNDMIFKQISDLPILKQIIVKIKQELIALKIYSFEKFKSIDVYDAVLNHNIKDIDGFLNLYNNNS